MSTMVQEYYNTISNFPLLTAEEEKELIKKVKNGSKYARAKLANCNLRLVFSIAVGYRLNDEDTQDLISSGNLGLLTAIDHYDETKNIRFSTYAYNWINAKMRERLQEMRSLITVPTSINNDCGKLRQIENYLIQVLGHTPDFDDYAAYLNGAYTPEEINDCLRIMSRQIVSLDNVVYNSDDDSDITVGDIIADPHTENGADYLIKSEKHRLLQDLLRAKLTDKEYQVVTAKYGLNDQGKESTLQEISEYYHCTRENIRQIITRAINKIKADSEAMSLLAEIQ